MAKRKSQPSDALKVLFALVAILVATTFSHETPEKVQEARAVTEAQAEVPSKHHPREEKRKLSVVPFISRINGSI